MVLPATLDITACERQLIRSAVVLAQHLDRQARWWFSGAIEFSQTSVARCHSKNLPSSKPRKECPTSSARGSLLPVQGNKPSSTRECGASVVRFASAARTAQIAVIDLMRNLHAAPDRCRLFRDVTARRAGANAGARARRARHRDLHG